MATSHFNALTEAEAERLAFLIEKCADVQKIACKVLRHGYGSTNPVSLSTDTNREMLQYELGQVMLAFRMLEWDGDIDKISVMAGTEAKAGSVRKYLHHQV